jgi:L,D-transpeptidase YbiS
MNRYVARDSVITLEVSVSEQRLVVFTNGYFMRDYPVSTAKNGVGEICGSEQTPRGWHIIRAKIGTDMPKNTVFVGRRSTGEIYHVGLRAKYPERDWILTRILWLSGLEVGKNRLGDMDTMRRYIYVHGTPDDVPMGIPGSRGCIRMRNIDMIDLFNLVPVRTRLLIHE